MSMGFYCTPATSCPFSMAVGQCTFTILNNSFWQQTVAYSTDYLMFAINTSLDNIVTKLYPTTYLSLSAPSSISQASSYLSF